MKSNVLAISAALLLGSFSGSTLAGLSEAELEQLGTTLTPWGAEIAGSEDGAYPAYTGGIKAPEGFDPASGVWPDPYPDDKPLFAIDASNMEQYADKLMAGQMELMRRFPSFRMDIYPSRRGVWMSEQVTEATQANARNPECKTSADGVGLYGCWGGVPFPQPKTAYEAMWNHNQTVRKHYDCVAANYLVNSSGAITFLVKTNIYYEFVYFDPEQEPYEGSGKYYSRLINYTLGPPRDVGQQTMLWYPLHFDKDDQRAWSYTPGQRRVRLAPEFSYDTPSAQLGGTVYYDEYNMFLGRMDRFKFDLVGKQLMYMPYNNYRLNLIRDPKEVLGPDHVNPDKVRWELRRVWVVEATTLPGKRHVASKKRYYIDEDTWAILAYEAWDHSDKLFRVNFAQLGTDYANGGVVDYAASMAAYDLVRGQYSAFQTQHIEDAYFRVGVPRRLEAEMSPAYMGGRGIR
jgi:Protein of unknown function (DUF1329)